MPLRALINNIEINAPLLSDDEWEKLKLDIKHFKYDVIIPCCNQKGFLRTSSLGLNHFCHQHDNETKCNRKPISPEHLSGQIEIIRACEQINWTAKDEVEESSWRADVLAIQDKKRIAFEIQISRQTYDETTERQEKFIKSNVRGCWFFKKLPKELMLKKNEEIPAFEIIPNKNLNTKVIYNHKDFKLSDFVKYLLNKRVRFIYYLKNRTRQIIPVSFFRATCYNCNYTFYKKFIDYSVLSKCGEYFNIENEQTKKFIYEQIGNRLNEIIKLNNYSISSSVSLKNQYNVDSYIYSNSRFFCPKCDTCNWEDIVFVRNERLKDNLETEIDGNRTIYKFVVDLKEVITTYKPHWCLNINDKFCND